jgi:hypothetical protein
MFLGTVLDNNQDMNRKGRGVSGPKHVRAVREGRKGIWEGLSKDERSERMSKVRRAGLSSPLNDPSVVKQVREMYATGKITQRQIAKKLNVNQANISHVIRRELRWKSM